MLCLASVPADAGSPASGEGGVAASSDGGARANDAGGGGKEGSNGTGGGKSASKEADGCAVGPARLGSHAAALALAGVLGWLIGRSRRRRS